jgi:phosphate transport system permease protein
MTDATATPAPLAAPRPALTAREAQQRRLRRRYASEARFRWYGRIAIFIALGFLALLLTRVVSQGYTAFWTHSITLDVRMDPARIDPAYIEGTNFNVMGADAVIAKLGWLMTPRSYPGRGAGAPLTRASASSCCTAFATTAS